MFTACRDKEEALQLRVSEAKAEAQKLREDLNQGEHALTMVDQLFDKHK